MKVLVTGGSGHIGSNVVHALVGRGLKPRVLVRETSDTRAIDGLDIELVRGDVLDAGSVRAALDGMETVIHTAAIYKNWTPDPDAMATTAGQGTRNVFEAAKDAGVKRIVYTSSSNCVGFQGTVDAPLDETHFNDNPHAPYVKAKVEAEKLAWELAKQTGIDTVAVLPTGVMGRFDHKVTPTTQNLLDILQGKGPFPFDLNFVDVADVGEGHVLAAEKGTPGERYLLGGDNVRPSDFARWAKDELGISVQTSLPPAFVLRMVAMGAELFSAVTGREPMLTRPMVNEITSGTGIAFDISKARNALGYEPAGWQDVTRVAASWCAFAGLFSDQALAARITEKWPPDPAWKL